MCRCLGRSQQLLLFAVTHEDQHEVCSRVGNTLEALMPRLLRAQQQVYPVPCICVALPMFTMAIVVGSRVQSESWPASATQARCCNTSWHPMSPGRPRAPFNSLGRGSVGARRTSNTRCGCTPCSTCKVRRAPWNRLVHCGFWASESYLPPPLLATQVDERTKQTGLEPSIG